MHFWEFNFNLIDAVFALGIVTVIFLLANTLRVKIKFIRNTLLPTSVIGGVIVLLLKSTGVFDSLLNIDEISTLFESITYHSLAIGFIALGLKSNEKAKRGKERQLELMDTGLLTVNSYLIQGIAGAAITALLAMTFMSDLIIPAAGLLLPMGFGQGSGQALSFGRIFENTYGFAGGANFGLMIAAVGFMVACIGGAIHILVRRRNGSLIAKNLTEYEGTEKISSPNEVPATESVDRLSIQVALITAVYFVVFLIMYGVEQLEGGNFLNNTIKPLFWGFNFLFGSVVALLVKVMFDFFKKKKVMERDYTNDYLLNRISGFSFDLMIIAGIAAIKIEVLIPLIIPLVILAVVGTFITYFYVRKVSYYLYPTYKDEGFLVMFGMLTGTASTGMILLREVDPHYETPAANNLVYQQIYAIMFGFPIYVFMAYAPLGLNETWITVAVLTLLFIIYNIIIFRKKIFKKKAKI